MARQEVSRTTHIEEGELRVTHENAILTNVTVSSSSEVRKPLNTGRGNSSECKTGRIADGILGQEKFCRFFFPIPFVFTKQK